MSPPPFPCRPSHPLSAALLTLPLLLAVASPTAANPAQPTTSWRGGPVPGQGGAPTYCAIEAGYSNGITLAIGRTAAGDTTLVLGMPVTHRLSASTRVPIRLAVDGTTPRTHTGVVLTPSLLAIPLGRDAQFYAALQSGHTLTVAGPTDAPSFALAATRPALTALAACAANPTRHTASVSAPVP